MRSGHIAVGLSVCVLIAVGSACSSEQPPGSTSGSRVSAPTAPASTETPVANPAAGAAGAGAGHGQAPVATQPDAMTAPGSGEGVPSSPDGVPPAQTPTPGTGGMEFCGVQRLMQLNCQACHAAMPIAGAPMPLVTWDDFMKPASTNPNRKVHELVRERMHDTMRPMPPPGILPQDQLSVRDAWLNTGALQPSAACPEPPPVEGGPGTTAQSWPPADCEDLYTITAHDLMDASKPYTVAAGSEEHPRISFDAPWGDDDVQLLATRPITDNPNLIHHWILWNALEGTNLTFWAPGAGGDVLPPDVGMFVPKGPASLSLDMHYFNKGNAKWSRDVHHAHVPAQDCGHLRLARQRHGAADAARRERGRVHGHGDL
jgi:hypothetical protein